MKPGIEDVEGLVKNALSLLGADEIEKEAVLKLLNRATDILEGL